MAYIYQIRNDINDKIYVGKTEFSIEKRFKEHCKDAYRERNEKRPLYAAMRKYGVEHFHISLLEETNNPEEREKFWIEELKTYHNGYNATLGGDGKAYIDYDLVIETYAKLLCVKDVAATLGICTDSVKHILKLNNIKIRSTAEINLERHGKGVRMKNIKNDTERTFPSISEAARFLIANGKTQSTKIVTVGTSISRAINKQRAAYGYEWQFV